MKSGYSERLFRPHTFKLANLKVHFWSFNKLLKVSDDGLYWLSVPFLAYSVSPDDGGRSGSDDVSVFLALDLDRLFDLAADLPEATSRPLPSDLLETDTGILNSGSAPLLVSLLTGSVCIELRLTPVVSEVGGCADVSDSIPKAWIRQGRCI